MKKIITILSLVSLSLAAFADFAPSSGMGVAAIIQVQNGTGFLADTGRAVFASDVSGNGFALLGDDNIDDGYGTYTWVKTSPDTVALTLNDEVSGVSITYTLTFNSSDAGTFTASADGIGTQSGSFDFYYILQKSDVGTAFGIGQPVASVENGQIHVDFQLKSSDTVSNFTPAGGTVSLIDTGKVRFSTDATPGSKFFTIEATEAP